MTAENGEKERNQTRNGLFLFLLREEWIRLKGELISKKGFAVLAVLFYVALDVCLSGREGESLFLSAGIAGYWLVFLFPIRLGKMFYLLPFYRQEQKSYILQKFLVSLLYILVFLLLCGGILSLFTKDVGESMGIWIISVFLIGLPLWIYAEAMLLLNRSRGARTNYGFFTTRAICPEAEEAEPFSADWSSEYDLNSVKASCQNTGTEGQKKKKNREEKKENKKEAVIVAGMLAGLMLLLFGGIFLSISKSTGYIAFVLFFYGLAIAAVAAAFRVIFREIDGVKKPQKGGDGCSL